MSRFQAEPLPLVRVDGYDCRVGLSVVVRSRRKNQVLALALATPVLSAALFYGVASWMPDWYEQSVYPGRPGVPQGGHPTSGGEANSLIRLEVRLAEPAVQLEWTPNGDSELSGAALTRFLRIEWAVEESLVLDSVTATLEIQDGELTEIFPIEQERLAQGSRIYFPSSADVRLEMRIQSVEGSDQVAVARFVAAQAPSPASRQSEADPGPATANAPTPQSSGSPVEETVRATQGQPPRETAAGSSVTAPVTPGVTDRTSPADPGTVQLTLTEKKPASQTDRSEDPPRE